MENSLGSQIKRKKYTLITPYVALIALAAPNILVIAYVKPTAGYAALSFTSWFFGTKLILGFLLVLAAICAIVYMVRAEGKAGRIWVALTLIASWAGFIYGSH